MAGGSHTIRPFEYTVAFVNKVTTNAPSALKYKEVTDQTSLIDFENIQVHEFRSNMSAVLLENKA